MPSRKRKRIQTILVEQFALLSVELLLVLVLSVVAILAFYQMSSLLLDDEIAAFDDRAYYLVRYYASPFLDQVMLTATFLGNRQFIMVFAVAILIYFLFIKPHRWYSIKIPAVAIGSISANLLLKEWYDRARPTVNQIIQASGLSFPSGHAMFNLSFYGLLIYLIWREVNNRLVKVFLALFISILILLIGLSRIYLGVHYASDVLAGFSAGFLWLVIALYITNTIERRIKRKQKTNLQEKALESTEQS